MKCPVLEGGKVVVYNTIMLIGQVEIHLKSYKDEEGMLHLRGEKFVPHGGQNSGDLIFEVKPTLNTLSSFLQYQQFKTERGVRAGDTVSISEFELEWQD